MRSLDEFWKDIEGVPPFVQTVDLGGASLVIALLSVLACLVVRHRMTAIETIVLAALSVVLSWRGAEMLATVIAVLALVNALRGAGRRKNEDRSRAMDRRLAELGETVDVFIEALDRRTSELDKELAGRDEHALARAVKTVTDLVPAAAPDRSNGSLTGSAAALHDGDGNDRSTQPR